MSENKVDPVSKMAFDELEADIALAGLKIETLRDDYLRGWAEVDESHHQPWGIVHGGVWTALVETAGSVGSSYAVSDQGMVTVGVNNNTNFIRSIKKGKVIIEAKALHQGRTQQIWDIEISAEETGKLVAQGQLRVQNMPAK